MLRSAGLNAKAMWTDRQYLGASSPRNEWGPRWRGQGSGNSDRRLETESDEIEGIEVAIPYGASSCGLPSQRQVEHRC